MAAKVSKLVKENEKPDSRSDNMDVHRLPDELYLEMFRRMVLIRKFEETVYDVYSRGIMPGLAHLYTA